jgi:hypothetical protein
MQHQQLARSSPAVQGCEEFPWTTSGQPVRCCRMEQQAWEPLTCTHLQKDQRLKTRVTIRHIISWWAEQQLRQRSTSAHSEPLHTAISHYSSRSLAIIVMPESGYQTENHRMRCIFFILVFVACPHHCRIQLTPFTATSPSRRRTERHRCGRQP